MPLMKIIKKLHFSEEEMGLILLVVWFSKYFSIKAEKRLFLVISITLRRVYV